ncbi:MAG: hypothetical protein EA407_05135 [Rhodobacteraceae bacterium]|nr:MAG: hypothetical protein EA407_05135 [Paracoccaceae bacterium]
MTPFRRFALWLAPAALVACLAPPDLPPSQAGVEAPAPELLPLTQLLAEREDGPHTARLTDAPDARATALQARAAQLRVPVITAPDRQQMLNSGPGLR